MRVWGTGNGETWSAWTHGCAVAVALCPEWPDRKEVTVKVLMDSWILRRGGTYQSGVHMMPDLQ